MGTPKSVFITGGGGYVGAVLVPKLLNKGYRVKVLDLFIYGKDVFEKIEDHPLLSLVQGDIRDASLLEREIPGTDTVIHLACISNDPSFELNAELGKSINYDAFLPLIRISKQKAVKRFIYASSSSVYGIKETAEVTEDLPLEPLTDYSKYKAECEDILLREIDESFVGVIVRPATLCGYSPRLRLDLTVNILTNHAINKGKITVFGGKQLRPNLHIEDMTDVYLMLIELEDEKIQGEVFNVGYENYSVRDIAFMVRKAVAEDIPIETVPTDDNRSYHISSKKIKDKLDFIPMHSVEDAIKDLSQAFQENKVQDPMTNQRYYNIKTMQAVELT